MRRLLCILLLLFLTACSDKQTTGYSEPVPEATRHSIYIATQRRPDQTGKIFGEARSKKLHFARMDVSVPPTHKLGRLERSGGIANPHNAFAPLGVETYPNMSSFSRALDGTKTEKDSLTFIFIHGYNNTLEDAALRLTQIKHDFEIDAPTLLFSWPSAGQNIGYIYDRDSVLFARTDLVRLLSDLRATGQRRIFIVAHSMGTYLTMESLRQMALEGDRDLMNIIEGVVLMSPDIDPDVFRRQVEEIGDLPQPFVIMTTKQDKVLGLSSLLTGLKPRLGRIQNADEVKDLPVTVLDFSLLGSGQNGGHLAPVSSPVAIEFLRKLENGASNLRSPIGRYVLLGKDPIGPSNPITGER